MENKRYSMSILLIGFLFQHVNAMHNVLNYIQTHKKPAVITLSTLFLAPTAYKVTKYCLAKHKVKNLQEQRNEALFKAIEDNDEIAVVALLAQGANVNATKYVKPVVNLLFLHLYDEVYGEETDQTPLMVAARYGRSNIIKVLLQACANPLLKTGFQGNTALMIAVKYAQSSIVALLINHVLKHYGSIILNQYVNERGRIVKRNAFEIAIVYVANDQANEERLEAFFAIVKLLVEAGSEYSLNFGPGSEQYFLEQLKYKNILRLVETIKSVLVAKQVVQAQDEGREAKLALEKIVEQSIPYEGIIEEYLMPSQEDEKKIAELVFTS